MLDVARIRADQQRLLHRAERRLDAASLAAIGGWLDAFRVALLQELGVPERLVSAADGQGMNAQHADYAIDNAVARSWGEWQNRLENQVLPTVSIAFGEAFQQQRRGDPQGAFALQQEYLANVSDRLKIWPAGAFEDIRPELLEALSDASTIEDMTEKIGRVLTIDARSRELRARIGDVDEALLNPQTPISERPALAAMRRDLWERHDEALNEWQWKARRIARTESHGAVSAGQLAAAQVREQETGVRTYKRWLSTDDPRTRASHRVADGQVVPLDQAFRVGGFLLQHPADSISVAPHEVINCRCTMIVYDDDMLQEDLAEQGGHGDVEPGAVRMGPDDPDVADAAIAAVAEAESRALPKLGQRGEEHGQVLPVDVEDPVELTDERTRVPAPDVETASDERLADYLIRTDELLDDQLRREVEGELTRRNEDVSVEAQYGQPEDADDVIEIDDDGEWLNDPRWADDAPPVVDEPFTPDTPWEAWPSDDDLPGDVVPADEPEIVEDIGAGELSLEAAQAANDAALEAFTEAAESGDDARIEAALLAMDEAESRLTQATQLAEVLDEVIDEPQVEPDSVDVAEQLDDDEPADDLEEFFAQFDTDPEPEVDALDEVRAQDRARYAEIWGEAAAVEEFDSGPAVKELTAAERRRFDLMEQAEERAHAEGITYEQALAQVQGLDIEQVRRREFVEAAKRENLVSTTFDDLLSELHRRFVLGWVDIVEAESAHVLKKEYRSGTFGHDMLWQVNDNTARKYMSEEAELWFDENGGRITKAELERMIEAGIYVFDAEACLAEHARWDGRHIGEDYHR